MSDNTSLSDDHRYILMDQRKNRWTNNIPVGAKFQNFIDILTQSKQTSDEDVVCLMTFLTRRSIFPAVGRVHGIVILPMIKGIMDKSDDEFLTTTFVGSPTKSSCNFDNRSLKISPECTSDKSRLWDYLCANNVVFICRDFG